MNMKKFDFKYFSILLIPMLMVSALLNLVYSLEVHDFIQLNWYAIIAGAIILDVFITWAQSKPGKDSKSDGM